MKRVNKAILEIIALRAKYPRICELGLEIKDIGQGYKCVKWEELHKALRKRKIAKLYGQYYGMQTAHEYGPYVHDVEAVLERIFSGNLTGTQKYWD